MERITVTLGERSYPITIAAGLFNDPASFLPLKAGDQAMLVTNETLAPLYLDRVRHLLEQAGVKVDSVILPDGEQYKSLTVLDTVFTALLQNRTVVIQHCLPRRRRCGRSDRFCSRQLPARRALYSNSNHVALTGRFFCGR